MKKSTKIAVIFGLISLSWAVPSMGVATEGQVSIPTEQLSKGELQVRLGLLAPKYSFKNDPKLRSLSPVEGQKFADIISVVPDATAEFKKAQSANSASVLLAIVAGALFGFASSKDGSGLAFVGIIPFVASVSLGHKSEVHLRRSADLYNKEAFGH